MARTRGTRMKLEGPADIDPPVLRRTGCTVGIVSFWSQILVPNAGSLEQILVR